MSIFWSIILTSVLIGLCLIIIAGGIGILNDYLLDLDVMNLIAIVIACIGLFLLGASFFASLFWIIIKLIIAIWS